jgi:hypothetical protein
VWSGLAVNDLSSAIAVGKQMGGEELAAAAKSARVLLLAPMMLTFAMLRQHARKEARASLWRSALDHLPRFLLGYVALAAARIAGDGFFAGHEAWEALKGADKLLVDLTMVTVSAAIGLHLEVRRLFSAGWRALVVGGTASVWMALVALAMVTLASRGTPAAAALVGVTALLASAVLFRAKTGREREERALRHRFESGAPLSLAEATRLLDALERDGPLDEPILRRLLAQLFPAIGELIPVRESPLPHGEGCRWVTYWEGKTGWALVAVCREPGSATPIHAHPHRLLGKAIEGMLEELRFREEEGGRLALASRKVLAHNEFVETDGLATPHLVRAVGHSAAIDLQLRGPEVGTPGRRFRTAAPLDVDGMKVGTWIAASLEIDDRPGQGGEGAGAGRARAAAAP